MKRRRWSRARCAPSSHGIGPETCESWRPCSVGRSSGSLRNEAWARAISPSTRELPRSRSARVCSTETSTSGAETSIASTSPSSSMRKAGMPSAWPNAWAFGARRSTSGSAAPASSCESSESSVRHASAAVRADRPRASTRRAHVDRVARPRIVSGRMALAIPPRPHYFLIYKNHLRDMT